MKRRFKLKINGESPRSLLLAFFLAKIKCEVYLYDFSRISYSKKDYQIFLFSNNLKVLLCKFDIWNEIEDISYGFTSLSIQDNLVSEQLLLRAENFSKKQSSTIGWTARYSDIKRLFIKKLINYENVHFISKNQLIDPTLVFDYEFNFENYNKILNLFKLPLLNFKREDEYILTFNVYLRGNIEKRLYEINTTKGLLVLTPLERNLYQISWNNASLRIKETSLSSKSLFLDNLSTLLPNKFKIDQIIGNINSFHVCNKSSIYLIKNNSISFNENKFKSNILYDFNFDIFIRNLVQIYNFFENIKSFYIKSLNNFGFIYMLRKYIEISMNFSFFNFLFKLFTVNNLITLFLRKLLFILLKRINLIKILFIRYLNNYNINNNIK